MSCSFCKLFRRGGYSATLARRTEGIRPALVRGPSGVLPTLRSLAWTAIREGALTQQPGDGWVCDHVRASTGRCISIQSTRVQSHADRSRTWRPRSPGQLDLSSSRTRHGGYPVWCWSRPTKRLPGTGRVISQESLRSVPRGVTRRSRRCDDRLWIRKCVPPRSCAELQGLGGILMSREDAHRPFRGGRKPVRFEALRVVPCALVAVPGPVHPDREGPALAGAARFHPRCGREFWNRTELWQE